MTELTCIVCKSETSKYKCPNCLQPYCSMPCCKDHKTVKCVPPEPEKKEEDTTNRSSYSFTTKDTVSIDKLKLLENSEGLKNCLKNPHLRKILINLDKCEVPDKMIKEFMQEPIFTEFVDECLKVVEPPVDKNV